MEVLDLSDPLQDMQWQHAVPLQVPRSVLSTFVVDGKIHAFGGITETRTHPTRVFLQLRSMEHINPESDDAWSMAEFPEEFAFDYHAAIVPVNFC